MLRFDNLTLIHTSVVLYPDVRSSNPVGKYCWTACGKYVVTNHSAVRERRESIGREFRNLQQLFTNIICVSAASSMKLIDRAPS